MDGASEISRHPRVYIQKMAPNSARTTSKLYNYKEQLYITAVCS